MTIEKGLTSKRNLKKNKKQYYKKCSPSLHEPFVFPEEDDDDEDEEEFPQEFPDPSERPIEVE